MTVPDRVREIDCSAFCSCNELRKITIPASVETIGSGCFSNCSSLGTIIYCGTMAQWKAISKGDDWISETSDITVVCTDGKLLLPRILED